MMPNDINRSNYNINYFNVVTLQSRVLPEKLKSLRYPGVYLFHETASVVNLYIRHNIDACHEPHGSNLERLCQISKRISWISTCLSVRPSARPHGATRLPLDRFFWNLILKVLNKMPRSTSSYSNSKENNVYFTWICSCVAGEICLFPR